MFPLGISSDRRDHLGFVTGEGTLEFVFITLPVPFEKDAVEEVHPQSSTRQVFEDVLHKETDGSNPTSLLCPCQQHHGVDRALMVADQEGILALQQPHTRIGNIHTVNRLDSPSDARPVDLGESGVPSPEGSWRKGLPEQA